MRKQTLLFGKRFCSKCSVVKPLNDFYNRSSSTKQDLCKRCYSIRRKKRYLKMKHILIPYKKKWRDKNRVRLRLEAKKRNLMLKLDIINGYGSKCSCCGETNKEFLTIEHKLKDGKKDLEKFHNSRGIYTYLKRINYPKDNYTLYCMNCNFATRFGAKCPHVSSVKK